MKRDIRVSGLTLVLLALLAACSPAAPPAQPTAVPTTATPTQVPTKAPTETPIPSSTVVPTLPPAERNYEWIAAEAVTVKTRLTDQELSAKMEEFHTRFPLVYDSENGSWYQRCTLESISFLKEGNYISIGDIRVTGQCSYLDLNEEKQTITIALAVQNSVNSTTWMPYALSIIDGVFVPSFIQEAFTDSTTIEPGAAISVSLGWPNPANKNEYVGREHHADLISDFYTEEQIEAYANSGDPKLLNGLLIPFFVKKADSPFSP